MNRFVRNLLPLCVLVVVAAPQNAYAAEDVEAARLDLSQLPKVSASSDYKERFLEKLLESNDCYIEAKDRLKDIIDKLNNGNPGGGGDDSQQPQEPEDPDTDEQEDTDPSEEPNPEDPSEGEAPGDSGEPEEPEEPEWPGEPEEPETPVEPEEPQQPEEPEDPGLPVNPGRPQPPITPGEPDEPEITEPELPASVSSYAREVAKLVNQERAAAGLAPLSFNTELSKVAEVKAADMRDRNYFSHTSPTYGSPFDMMKQFGVSYKSAGENIAKGQKTPESVMNSWMNSSGHKANILSTSYTEIGVGYVTGSNGTTYWVQMFIRP